LEKEVTQLATSVDDPGSILKALKHDPANIPGKSELATLFVAVIDSDRHELTLATAGAIPPLVRRADRRVENLATEICGFPLWLVPGQSYKNVTVPFGPGEVVIFHTDGVTAVTDHRGCPFHVNSLRQAIAHAPDDAASVGQSILEAIRRFAHGRTQVDDITLLCLRRALPTNRLGRTVSR
jgi:serine phosphatase RsbU (regulator of sigma subunit)